MLRLLVLLAGMDSMAIEMSAARLLSPFFGTSLYIWAILIGLMLVYLTAGYWLGGRLADIRPHRRTLYELSAIAALVTGVIALIATPVLQLALVSTASTPFGLLVGAIAGCLVLFAVPVALLGCVNPFAIRLNLGQVERAGNVSGAVFALTTIGSLIGTFGSVFLLIPTLGTRATLLSFGALLLTGSLVGLLIARR